MFPHAESRQRHGMVIVPWHSMVSHKFHARSFSPCIYLSVHIGSVFPAAPVSILRCSACLPVTPGGFTPSTWTIHHGSSVQHAGTFHWRWLRSTVRWTQCYHHQFCGQLWHSTVSVAGHDLTSCTTGFLLSLLGCLWCLLVSLRVTFGSAHFGPVIQFARCPTDMSKSRTFPWLAHARLHCMVSTWFDLGTGTLSAGFQLRVLRIRVLRPERPWGNGYSVYPADHWEILHREIWLWSAPAAPRWVLPQSIHILVPDYVLW